MALPLPCFILTVFVLPQNDGLVRVNDDSIVEDAKESPVRPVTFTPSPPKPAVPSPQRVSEISTGSETAALGCAQTSSVQTADHVEEERLSRSSPVTQSPEDESSKTLTDSEPTGRRPFLLFDSFVCLFGDVTDGSACCF